MRNTSCVSGLWPGFVGSALVVAGLLLAAPVSAAPQTYTNSIGMKFVLIPAGRFQMGCSSDAEQCEDHEKPRHAVTISKPFYLGRYEVTQAQWQSVMGENPSYFKGLDRPVENVTWNEVQEFIKRLNAREGHSRYRLPTEAEWEYAARAGSTTVYSFGDDERQLGKYAWHNDVNGSTHPVGEKIPNAWGLHDMHGNVWEWVQDGYRSYRGLAVADPQGPANDASRMARGGSWHIDFGWGCRVAARLWRKPDYYDRYIGFRLALSPGR